MSSIWKDLLYLHGYLIRKDDLIWRTSAAADPADEAAAEISASNGDTACIDDRKSSNRCVSHPPRLAVPH